MADADPLLDPYLEEDDEKLLADVEGPTEPTVDGPVPSDLDEIAPAAAVAPPEPAPEAESAAAAPLIPPPAASTEQAVQARASEAEKLATRQGELDEQKATVQSNTATRIAEDARVADEDQRLEHADYLERRQVAEQDLDARVKAFEQQKAIEPHRNTFRSKLSVIFGGLGAAFRSAGGGDSRNTALANLQKQWENETEIQKANIAAARESMIQARTRLADVDEGRRRMTRDADARLLAKYNAALRQGEAQLKNHGVSQAEIDRDARILKLREARDARLLAARKDEDQHALNQARAAALKAQAERRGTPDDLRTAQIRVMNARAGILERKAKGGGGPSAKEKRAQEKHAAFMKGQEVKAATADEEKTVHIGTERKPAQAPTKKSAEDYRVFESSAQQVEGALEMLAENYKKYGIEISSVLPSALQSDAARERAAIMESIVLPAKEVGRLGALAGPDKSILVNITGGNAAQLLGDDIGIKAIRGWLGRARAGALNSLGINPDVAAPSAAPTAAPATPAKGPRAAPTAQQDSEAVQWAKRNLADPRARAILRANGVR